MSGRKQHFIPLCLLRGFGRSSGRSKTQVVVYSHDNGIFLASTDGIGAERNFCSEMSVEGGADTLDNKITVYESDLGEVLKRLRAASDWEPVAAADAANLVTHLAVRNGHLRNSASYGFQLMLEQLSRAFHDREVAAALLGISSDLPSSKLVEKCKEVWRNHSLELIPRGISEQQFQVIAHAFFKQNFSQLFELMCPLIQKVIMDLSHNCLDIAADSQRKSLDASLAPPRRVQLAQSMNWIVAHSVLPLVLPDCVSIGIDNRGIVRPLVFSESESTDTILMPVAADRLLIGYSSSPKVEWQELNEKFASCSWDFYVANQSDDQLKNLVPLLRASVNSIFGAAVREAIEELCDPTIEA